MAAYTPSDISAWVWLWLCLWMPFLLALWCSWFPFCWLVYVSHALPCTVAVCWFYKTSFQLELYCKRVCTFCLHIFLFSIANLLSPYCYRCPLCHSYKLGTVFNCHLSHLLADEGEVEYMVYKSVDLTEKSSRESATGNVMFRIPSNPKRDFDCQDIQTRILFASTVLPRL